MPSPSQQLREISREKSAEMTRLYSQMRQLGQHNAELVLKNIDANTKMADLGGASAGAGRGIGMGCR